MKTTDVYFNYPAGSVIDAPKIEDESCGLFPCYKTVIDGKQKISSSVGNLVKALGGLKEDISFNPHYNTKGNQDGSTYCWTNLTTIDTRIKKVKAFEGISFIPKTEVMTKDTFLDLSVKYLKEWVSKIETKFPDRAKIVLTGGRDSRIIHLIPKQNPSLWHIFSSFPDAPILKSWLDANKIPYNKIFIHKGFNDDTEDILTAKIVASDFICRPDDLRFAGKILEIAKEFGNKCLFITGNAGDTLYCCRDDILSRNDYKNYFDVQYKMLSGLQGSQHQMIFNLTNCPVISIYAAPELWMNVCQRFNPAVFKGQDLRPELGDRLAGRKLKWLGWWKEYTQVRADQICRQFDIKDKVIQEKMRHIYPHILLEWRIEKLLGTHLCIPHWHNKYTTAELRQRYVNAIK